MNKRHSQQVCLKVPFYINIDIPEDATNTQIREELTKSIRNQYEKINKVITLDNLIEATIFGELESKGNQTIITY